MWTAMKAVVTGFSVEKPNYPNNLWLAVFGGISPQNAYYFTIYPNKLSANRVSLQERFKKTRMSW